MTDTDYVSYPLALALKKHGFDEPCRDFYWTSDGTFKHTDAPVHKNSEHCTTMVAAPTLWQAQKWLRDRCGIHVYPTLESVNEVSYGCHIVHLHKEAFRVNKRYCSYESALSAGIAAALELIGEKGE